MSDAHAHQGHDAPEPWRAPGPELLARDAVQEESAFGHPPATPDATAAYGEHPDQVIDFYAPHGEPTSTGAPLVVAFHGGAWRSAYDRVHFSPFADFLARQGFAVASVEYRRGSMIPLQGKGVGAGRWPETLDDVAAALTALPSLVRTALPVADPHRTVLTGHSAGGHLALWAAARHSLPAGSRWAAPMPRSLRGVVALAPLVQLERARELGVCGDAAVQFLGGRERFEERLADADPYLMLPTGIATTLVHGREDLVVPAALSEAYAARAEAEGEPVGLTLLDDVGHFPLIDPASDAAAVAAQEIEQLAW